MKEQPKQPPVIELTKDMPPYQDADIYSIGDHTYGLFHILGAHLLNRLTVGKFCCIGGNVSLLIEGHYHNPNALTTYPFEAPRVWEYWHDELPERGKTEPRTIVIGHDVWIGDEVRIMSGVNIGSGAIIGTRAVVRKNVPPYAVVKGNPAEISRYRLIPADVERMMDIAWWTWPDETIREAAGILCHGTVDELATFAERRGRL